jgi:hypothetical protein
MDGYTNTARQKIVSLIKRDDFIKIESIKAKEIILIFLKSSCKVSDFGKVDWI